jgi:hypothetical protein
MPWRGPDEPGAFPTLGYLVADYIEAGCAIPDGDRAGEPFILTDEQLRFLLWHYRLRPDAAVIPSKPSAPFVYRRSQLVRPQKWGKGPLAAAIICAEADGPVLFAGWDAAGEPVGRPWATPWIQVTAVSEDQTANVWRALVPMIETGHIRADIPDTGETRINLSGGGRIEPVTSAARSRLGQRITFALQDQTESWLKRNGGIDLADNQRRGLGGMGGRSIETPNAWDPNERSVAQLTFESRLPDVYIDYPTPLKGSVKNKRERRKALEVAYGDSARRPADGRWEPWDDLDRIDAEIEELIQRGDPGQAERWYLNRVLPGADAAFDPEQWAGLARPDAAIPAASLVTLGFDGARRRDSTGIVVTEVATGLQLVAAVWERPTNADDDWEISEGEVDLAMEECFKRWDVWRLYADPPYWESTVDKWAGRWPKRAVSWWTNRPRPMALSMRAYRTSIANGELTHDGHEAYATHIANARRVNHPGMVDDEERPLWTIKKERPDSPNKIDLVMAGCLSWEARGDAIADGALNRRRYRTAGF